MAGRTAAGQGFATFFNLEMQHSPKIFCNFCQKILAKNTSEFGIRYHGLPEGEDASFFLCKELIPGYLDGVTGEYATPQGYFVDEAEAENFDKQFPYKEKLKLPGQLF